MTKTFADSKGDGSIGNSQGDVLGDSLGFSLGDTQGHSLGHIRGDTRDRSRSMLRRRTLSRSSLRQSLLGLTLLVSIASLSLTTANVAKAHDANLKRGLASAYNMNPTLRAARERVKAANWAVRESLGQGLPQITGSVNLSYRNSLSFSNGVGRWNDAAPFLSNINLNQRLYTGGSIKAGFDFIEMNTRAQWARVQATEQTVLSSVAQSYIAIAQAEALTSQFNKSASVLDNQRVAAQARFDAGEGTITEIAQARARVAQARGQAESARAGGLTSRATYRQLTGRNAGHVHVGNFPHGVPKSRNAAIEAALAFHPSIIAARFDQRAQQANIALQQAQRRPQVGLTAGTQNGWNDLTSADTSRTHSFSIGLQLTAPLYDGGQNNARVQQARANSQAAAMDIYGAQAAARQSAVAAWNRLESARALTRAFTAQQSSAALQLEGAQAELEFGTKTFLDVLDAEDQLQTARVGLVRSRYDEMIAAYQLLEATGQMTVQHLRLNVAYWDAEAHYRSVRADFDNFRRFLPFLPQN